MIQALQLILALSFLVVIHELGHFAFARIFKVRVEKFYIFFNPHFSLLRIKKFGGKWHIKVFSTNVEASTIEVKDAFGETKKDKNGQPVTRPMTAEELQSLPDDDWRKYPDNTEWGIGWIPVGGYCAIAGMVDETKSATDLPSEPQSWEFRSKNVWQRLCIIAGGILVNFVAALLIFGTLLYHWGEDTLPLHNVSTGLYYSELLQEEGFKQQDKIIAIDGEEPKDPSSVIKWLILEGKKNVTIARGTDTIQLVMSEDLGQRYLSIQNSFDRKERDKKRLDPSYQKSNYILVSEFIPFVIDSVFPDNAAYYAGLQKGDSITSICGIETPCNIQAIEELHKHPCESISIDFYRAGEKLQTQAFIGDQCKLGVIMKSTYDFFPIEHKNYTFIEAIPAGIEYGWNTLVMYVKQFKLVFSKEGAQSLGGFGAIGNMFPKQWNWSVFWHMTAFLSLILAFMNFLPIPALDGGYILFLLVEIFTGKQPSDKFLEKANNIGFWILLALLIYANGNDILKIFF